MLALETPCASMHDRQSMHVMAIRLLAATGVSLHLEYDMHRCQGVRQHA
jgi:hypothetical protein